MVTTKQKPTEDSLKLKRRESSIPLWKIIISQRRVTREKEGTRELQNGEKTIRWN